MANQIMLAGCPLLPPEKTASETITPGHLVEIVPSGGDAGKLRKHATASGDAAPFFALESLVPDFANTTAAIAKTYAAGDSVRWAVGKAGDVFYAWVPANAAAIKDGDELNSNADGTLKKYTAQATNEGGTATYTIQTRNIVARAAEDLDNSSTGTPSRIRVRVV